MAGERLGLANAKVLLTEQALALWKRKWVAVIACWAICIVGWGVVSVLPKRYESDARAFIDVNGLLTPLLKGMIVDAPASNSAEYLRQTLLSRPNLEQVAYMADLAKPGENGGDRERLLSDLASEISVRPDGPNLISISYTDNNPLIAKNVVQSLLTIFAENATSSSRAEMDRVRKFLTAQIANYETQLRAAERRRADFRRKYADYLPDENSGAPRLQTLQQQIAQMQQQYDDANFTKSSLAAEMAHVPATMSVDSSPTVSANGDLVTASPRIRLAQAQRTLAELQLSYTDKHPDVMTAKRTVAELQAQVASHGGGGEGRMQVPNPAYQALRLKYVDAESTIPLLKQRIDHATEEYNRVMHLSGDAPAIEAKAKDIDRDYDVIKANYDELVKRSQAAALSQAADDQADRTQFRIVEPPEVPVDPSFPNQPLMLSLVLAIGLAGGVGIPLALARMKPTFNSVSQLRDLGLPVLGAVAYVRRATALSGLSEPATRILVAASVGLFLLYSVLMVVSMGVFRGIL